MGQITHLAEKENMRNSEALREFRAPVNSGPINAKPSEKVASKPDNSSLQMFANKQPLESGKTAL